jgi:excisionase family DNA binding protein
MLDHTNSYLSTEPLLATVQQAAAALQVSTRTIWTLISNGALDYVKIGGSTRVPTDSLRALAQNGCAVVVAACKQSLAERGVTQ